MAISRQDRAKQFMGFDALKGLKEALKKKEIEYIDKIELSEESCQEIEKCFNKLEKGSVVEITYYYNRQYITVKGIIVKIDYARKKVELANGRSICLDDIYKIK